MTPAKWSEYPNFTASEFVCRSTGRNEMRHEFMVVLQAIRTEYGRPMVPTSGYRHPTHPVEARKTHSNGEHTQGMCCDIAVSSSRERFEIVQLALKHGITRIGIAKTFLHLGLGGPGLPDRVIWDYQ
jgi:zinc D-Ala-D-Ala carboxypeptidase